MTTQIMWSSNKWALEYLFSKKNFKDKKLAKEIYILDSILFTLRKKNLNANSMNFLCFVFGVDT